MITEIIQIFLLPPDILEIWVPPSEPLAGVGTGITFSGYTYSFWGIGALNHVQTLVGGQKYYLIDNRRPDPYRFDPLLFYQGGTAIGMLWIETPGGDLYSALVYYDETGIYFTPSSQLTNLPIGTTFRFTQTLILATT